MIVAELIIFICVLANGILHLLALIGGEVYEQFEGLKGAVGGNLRFGFGKVCAGNAVGECADRLVIFADSHS
ncbi:hypothetical protein Tco_0406907 [Tanacetum coccineum]